MRFDSSTVRKYEDGDARRQAMYERASGGVERAALRGERDGFEVARMCASADGFDVLEQVAGAMSRASLHDGDPEAVEYELGFCRGAGDFIGLLGGQMAWTEEGEAVCLLPEEVAR